MRLSLAHPSAWSAYGWGTRTRVMTLMWRRGGLVGEEVVEDLDVFFGFFVGGEVAALFEDH